MECFIHHAIGRIYYIVKKIEWFPYLWARYVEYKILLGLFAVGQTICESFKIWLILNFTRKSESSYRPVGPVSTLKLFGIIRLEKLQ